MVLGSGTTLELSREVVVAAGLQEGHLLSEEDQGRLIAEQSRQEARGRALRYLEMRERSRREVADRLRRYGYADDLVAKTLEYLEDHGLVDDRRFAAAYVREKLRAAWGPRRLKAELARKGVDRLIMDEVLASATASEPAGAEPETAEAADLLVDLVYRKFGRALVQDPQRGERRAASFLARRGHGWERIAEVMQQVREAGGQPEGEAAEGRADPGVQEE